MSARSPVLLTPLLLVGLLGCGDLQPLSSTPTCAAWTKADAGGVCRPRPWLLPAAGDTLGPIGARSVSAAIDGRGKSILGWEIDAIGVSGIAVAEERAAGSFALRSPSLRVATNAVTANAAQTRVAAGESGEAVVTWSQGGGDETSYIYASSRDAEGTWSDPAGAEDSFSFLPKGFQPFVATSPRGEWILAWNQWYDVNYGVALSRRAPGGEAWSRPRSGHDVLSVPIFYSNAPQVALDSHGAGLVVWFQSTGAPLMVYASERKAAEGEFSRPAKEDFLSAPGAPVDSHPVANPRPALSESGEAAVAWTQENGKGAIAVFLATRDRQGTWTRPRDLDDSFSPALGAARCAQVAFGPGGELYVIWYQDQGDGNAVYAARRDASGRWIEGEDGAHPVRLSAPGSIAYAPALAVGPGGGVIVVFTEEAAGQSQVAARRTSAGEVPWGAEEVLSPPGEGVADPAVAVGPGDRAIVAWAQGSFGNARIATARIE